MDISAGVVATMVAPTEEFLRPREITGKYPFRDHPTVAEWDAEAATEPRQGYGHGGSLRRFESIKPKGSRFRLADSHPAIAEGRTIFPTRVFEPHDVPRLLVSGVNSRKIGRVVMKGRWRGFPIFTLTLEERATCPRTCGEWKTCYGSNMQFARRIAHGEALERRLWDELAAKQAKHPKGFVVRLHVLGDFYSAEYVDLWAAALGAFPALRVFGYTAHAPDSEIGGLIRALGGGRSILRPLQRVGRADGRFGRHRARRSHPTCDLPRPDRRHRMLQHVRLLLAVGPHHRVLEALMADRICLDCPNTVSSQSKTGRCRNCALLAGNRDPAIIAKRAEGIRRKFADPVVRTRHAEACRRGKLRAMEDPAERERLRQIGLTVGLRNFQLSNTPEVRRRAAASIRERALAWCPPEHRDLNDFLRHSKGMRLADRQRIILELEPGTAEHGRREVANNILKSRLRHERQIAESY